MPDGNFLLATVIYKNKQGNEHTYELVFYTEKFQVDQEASKLGDGLNDSMKDMGKRLGPNRLLGKLGDSLADSGISLLGVNVEGRKQEHKTSLYIWIPKGNEMPKEVDPIDFVIHSGIPKKLNGVKASPFRIELEGRNYTMTDISCSYDRGPGLFSGLADYCNTWRNYIRLFKT